ncbi:MAG: response regulator [Desulfobacterales bacterium]|nr:response regulator [Desulfobacterales bacterium]
MPNTSTTDNAAKNFKLYMFIGLWIGLLLTYSPSLLLCDTEAKKVLFIHSSLKENDWNDHYMAGIQEKLNKAIDNVEYDVEYMDTKKVYGDEFCALFIDMLDIKYRKTNFNLIFITDYLILKALLPRKEAVFPETPIFFSDIEPTLPASLPKYITLINITQHIDIKENIELILRLHPDLRHIFVVTDNSPLGLKQRALIDNHTEKFGHIVFGYYNGEELSMEQLIFNLSKLPRDSAVILGTFLRDKTGRLFQAHRVYKQITQNSSVPVYALDDTKLGYGIVGGKLSQCKLYAYASATLALDYLTNGSIKDSQPEAVDNPYIFDDTQLIRWDINDDALPKDSQIINKRISFFQRHLQFILFICGIVFVLVVSNILFGIYFWWRKKEEMLGILFLDFIEKTSDYILITQFDHEHIEIIYINPALKNFLKLDDKTSLNHLRLSDIQPDWAVKRLFDEAIPHILKQGIWQGEMAIVSQENKTIPISQLILSHGMVDSEKHYLTMMLRDITDIVKAHEQIASNEIRLKELINTIADVVWESDTEGKFLSISPKIKKYLDYEPGEVIGNSLFTLLVSDELMQVKDILQRRFSTQKPLIDIKIWCAGKQNQHVLFLTNAIPVMDENEHVVGYRGLFKDITGQYKASEEKRRIDDRIRQAQKMKALTTLSAGIANDFSNILGEAINFNELALLNLHDHILSKNYIQFAFSACNQGKLLINQLVSYSGQFRMNLKPIELVSLIKDTTTAFKSQIPAYVTLNEHIDEHAGMILADAEQIQIALINLLTNAVYAMKAKGGTIEVVLSRKCLDLMPQIQDNYFCGNQHFKLSIKDQGEGIRTEHINRIFDPYFTTKTTEFGSGLGLAVVSGIVENHSGLIQVESQAGMGATFHIFLPIFDMWGIPFEEKILPKSIGNERILIIDDEAPIVDSLKQLLEHLTYEVESRTSSVEGLNLFIAKPDSFDLIIADLTMNNLSGEKLAHQVLTMRPNLPIILCSAFCEHMNQEKALLMGVRKLIMKPVEITELAIAIRSILDEQNPK